MTKMRKVVRNRRLNQLALTTALSGLSIFAYGRRAYAGDCAATGTPGTYLCAGSANAATDVTQALAGSPLEVRLAPGFSIDTSISGDDGFFLAGYGGLSFSDQGNVASVAGAFNGLSAVNAASSVAGDNSLTISASGTSFQGDYYYGLRAYNYGISTDGVSHLEITTGAVTGDDGGLFATNEGSGRRGSDLTIHAVGAVSGSYGAGLSALNKGYSLFGTSDVSVTTQDVSSGYGYGLEVINEAFGVRGSNVVINTLGGAISGDSAGIYVENIAEATVYGTTNLSVTTADVTAEYDAIILVNDPTRTSGASLILDTKQGRVAGTYGYGIRVKHGPEPDFLSGNNPSNPAVFPVTGLATLTITTAEVFGKGTAISATNNTYSTDSNTVTIDTTGGMVTGEEEYGIRVDNLGVSRDGNANLVITTAGVSGYHDGVKVRGYGDAAADSSLTLDTTLGEVTGTDGIGINVTNSGRSSTGASSVVITTANVTGDTYGIYAVNEDANSTGDPFSQDPAVVHGDTSLTVDTSAGVVLGATRDGIYVENQGRSGYADSSMFVTTAAVTGGENGIRANNDGRAENNSTLTLNTVAGTVVGTEDIGINVTNNGYAVNGSADTTITTASVGGFSRGLYALHNARGAENSTLTIDTTQGVVTATGDLGIGLYAINIGSSVNKSSDVSITTQDVTGDYGIYAQNYGAGALGSTLTVDTTAGDVMANTGDGLYAVNRGESASGAADLSVTTGGVSSGANGIDGRNYGVGKTGSSLIITTAAGQISAVTGRTGDGIYARNKGESQDGASDLKITTGDISANFFGISAANVGSGGTSSDLEIDTTAGSVLISSDATDGRDGLFASNLGESLQGTSDLTITTSNVSGALNGIDATNYSEGYDFADGHAGASMSIDTSAGTVVGTLENGIRVIQRGNSEDGHADLTISTGDVTGGKYGIKALANADGYAGSSVFIDTTAGTVTGQGEDGIEARNEGNSDDGATDLIITTAAVTGAEYGIFARNEADGYLGANLIIDTSLGDVDGMNRDGINAKNRGDASAGVRFYAVTTDLVITTGKVTGYNYGIYVRNYAEGFDGSNLVIDSRGSVTGTEEDGIYATNAGVSADGRSDLSITTHAVSGAKHGVFARNDASGREGSNVTIDTRLGAVTGEGRDGIDVRQSGIASVGETDILITTADVTGEEYGIRARNNSQGQSGASLSINTVSGSVEGKTLHGIYADSRSYSSFGYSDLRITTATVTGENIGVFARNDSTGFDSSSLIIDTTAGSVEGKTGAGIYAANLGYSTFGYTQLSVTTGDVTGAVNGIEAKGGAEGSYGGDVTIDTTAGFVKGTSGIGISAVSENEVDYGTTNLTITTANVEGALDGIYALSRGNGGSGSLLTIDTTAGSVEGRDGRGIYAIGDASSESGAIGLDITTADVTASRSEYVAGYRTTHSAIVLGLAGSGETGVSIHLDTTAGTISSPWAFGMLVNNQGTALDGRADTTIKTKDVDGLMGLDVQHYASGAEGSEVFVDTTAGGVTGSYGSGIAVRTMGQSIDGAVDIAVVTGDVTVQYEFIREPGINPGIAVRQKGTGRTGAGIEIDTTGGTISNYAGHAIYAYNSGIATEGRADTRIITGDLISNGIRGSGVRAEHFATGRDGADLIIDTSAGTLNGGTRTMGGVAVNGYQFGGSSQGTANLTITTGDVDDVNNGAIGAISYATAYLDASIVVDTTAGEIVSTALNSIGNRPVINVQNRNTSIAGNADITVRTGTVQALGFRRFGILVNAETRAHVNSDILVDTSAGSLVDVGIFIDSERYAETGSAEISVLSRHTGEDIFIEDNSSAVTSANITVDTTVGIAADASTDVDTAREGRIGIETTSQASAGTVNVDGTFGNIVAEDTAVRILHRGSGHTGADLTVDTTAAAIVGGTMAGLRDPDFAHLHLAEDIGINADHAGQSLTGTTNLRVTTSGVTGGATGIRAVNASSGYAGANLVIDTTGGAVTGRAGAGIDAQQTATSGDGDSALTLRTGAVSGTTYGIYALSEADSETGADVVIDTSAGSVTGTSLSGIRAIQTAYSYSESASLSITTGAVEGAGDGISAQSAGDSATSSNLTIDTTGGAVTALGGVGIHARQAATSAYGDVALTLRTGAVSGTTYGIFALSEADSETGADIVIDTTAGLVIGMGSTGIYASNSGSASAGTTDLTLTVGDVIGRTHAVHAVQNTDGDLTVRSSGGAAGGYVGYGLNTLTNGMGATDIALTNSGIFGTIGGIFADHGSSTGAFTIDVGEQAAVGNVSGLSSDLAIRARSEVTGLTLTNQAGGVLVGTLDLTAQDDVFNNAGTWRTAGGVNDFGGGTDVVNNSSLQTLVVGSGAANQVTFMNNLELFNNAGRVTFVDGFASDTLVLSGNFDGTGGVMEMEFDTTTLASDLLVVNGDVLGGPTTVVLTGIGGAGGLTGTNQNDGISLVQVGGTTSAADFQLAGSAQVDVFVYDSLSLGSDNVWRVQSAFLPSINGYEVYPSALLNMTKLAPYRDRLGARQVSMGQNGTQAWLQMDGTWLERDQEGSISGTSFEQNFTEITAGVDFATQGALTAGVNLRFSEGNTSINGPSGASTIKTEGYGIGGSLTWHLAGGVYVDTQAGYMAFSSDLPGNADNSGHGLATSVEVGRSLALPSDGWSMTQRAQLSYSMVDFDDMTGSFGEKVRLRDGESLTGRFGLALNRDWSGANGAANSVFGAMDLVHEVMPDTAVDVTVLNTTTFARSAAPNRIEFGLGGKIGLSETSYLHGALAVAQDFGDSDSQQISANFGFNIRW